MAEPNRRPVSSTSNWPRDMACHAFDVRPPFGSVFPRLTLFDYQGRFVDGAVFSTGCAVPIGRRDFCAQPPREPQRAPTGPIARCSDAFQSDFAQRSTAAACPVALLLGRRAKGASEEGGHDGSSAEL